jgi:hypothetical protein
VVVVGVDVVRLVGLCCWRRAGPRGTGQTTSGRAGQESSEEEKLWGHEGPASASPRTGKRATQYVKRTSGGGPPRAGRRGENAGLLPPGAALAPESWREEGRLTKQRRRKYCAALHCTLRRNATHRTAPQGVRATLRVGKSAGSKAGGWVCDLRIAGWMKGEGWFLLPTHWRVDAEGIKGCTATLASKTACARG